MNCPICNGTGKIEPKMEISIEAKRKAARALRECDYSIREIMKILKYKSPRSVQDLLTNKG